MRTEIESALGIKALNIYGLSEIMGPGVAMECLEGRNGMHIFEDHFLVETIDPATGAVLPPGEEEKLVFTTITPLEILRILASEKTLPGRKADHTGECEDKNGCSFHDLSPFVYGVSVVSLAICH